MEEGETIDLSLAIEGQLEETENMPDIKDYANEFMEVRCFEEFEYRVIQPKRSDFITRAYCLQPEYLTVKARPVTRSGSERVYKMKTEEELGGLVEMREKMQESKAIGEQVDKSVMRRREVTQDMVLIDFVN